MMYLRHFALTRFPFHDNLASDELFDSTAISEAEARLHHLLELKGIGLLTGEVGCGKTTVCRKVTAALHSGLYRLFYVTLSTGNVMDMYEFKEVVQSRFGLGDGGGVEQLVGPGIDTGGFFKLHFSHGWPPLA